MALPSVFISYNPNSELEQTLAVRLHTIGAVNGFQINLPDRSAFQTSISSETIYRIKNSSYFILFSTTLLSSVVLKEIECAFSVLHDRSKIIVIYDKRIGKNLSNATNCTEIYIDPSADISAIMTEITSKVNSLHKQKSEGISGLGGLILTGLGLFALASIFSDYESDRPRRKKGVYKKPAKKKTTAKKRRRS